MIAYKDLYWLGKMEDFVEMLKSFPSCEELDTAIECVRKEDTEGFIEAIQKADTVPDMIKGMLVTSIRVNCADIQTNDECLKAVGVMRTRITNLEHVKILDDIEKFIALPDGADIGDIPDIDVLIDEYPEELYLCSIAGYITVHLRE